MSRNNTLNLTLVSLDLLTYLSRKRSIESLASVLYNLIRRFYQKPFKIWNKSLFSLLSRSLCSSLYVWRSYSKAAWLSDKRFGLAIWRSQVRVPFWTHDEFGLFLPDLNPPPFCQLVASCPLKFLSCCAISGFGLFVSNYLSGVPVSWLDKLSALSTINKYLLITFSYDLIC